MEKVIQAFLRERGREILEMDGFDLPEDMEAGIFQKLEEIKDLFKKFGGHGEKAMVEAINQYILLGLFYWWDTEVLVEKGITYTVRK